MLCCGSVDVVVVLPASPSVSPSFPPWVGPSAISKLRLSSRSFLRAVRLGHSLPPFPAHLVLDSHPSASHLTSFSSSTCTNHPSQQGERRGRRNRREAEKRSRGRKKRKQAERIDSHIVCSHWPHAILPSHFPSALHLAASPPRTPTTTTNQPTRGCPPIL